MRFPDTPYMKRTFELAREKLSSSPRIKLIPYHLSCKNTWRFFNGKRLSNADWENRDLPDPFNIGSYISDAYAEFRNPAKAMDQVAIHMNGITTACGIAADGKGLELGLQKLISRYDQHTMRTYLQQQGLPSEVINVLETFDTSTGGYDHALVETVCESLAFSWVGNTSPEYFCFE